MKTLLNLLPEEKKAALERRIRSRFLLWQTALLFFLEMFYFGVLFGIFFVLGFQLQTLQRSDAEYLSASFSQEQKLAEFEGKFRGTNEAIDVVGKIEREHLRFASVLSLLEETLPSGIVINRLTTKEYTVNLTGRAATREDLLILDERLKKSTCLEKINVPISNLFSQTEVDFQLNFSVRRGCLLQNI